MFDKMDNFEYLNDEILQEKNLYICHTYYHVLIAILKCLKNGFKSDIMLATENKKNFLFSDSLFIDRLRESKIFCDIIIFDYSREEIVNKQNLSLFYRIYLGNKIIRKKTYDLFKYKNVYIFNEHGLIGYILNKQKIYYNLLEDGMDCFKSKYKGTCIINEENPIKKYMKKFLKIYNVAESPYIKTIEVNDKKDVVINHSNIIECPKKELFSSLRCKDKEKILKIFLEKPDDLLTFSDSILILTQPLSEDNICSNEEEKIEIYKKVIKDYTSNENVIIKTHIREKTDYLKNFKEYKNVKIITERFPVEVLNFLNIKFRRAITIFSTSINIIENCDEKIELGYEYINNKLEKKC